MYTTKPAQYMGKNRRPANIHHCAYPRDWWYMRDKLADK